MRYKVLSIILIFSLIGSVSLLASTEEIERLPFFESITEYLEGPDGYHLLSTTHDILGYSAVALGLTAGLLSPDLFDVDEDLHGAVGTAAATAAALNIGVGFLNFGDRLETSEGLFTIDNIHILMGIAGGVLMVSAGLANESDPHPWLGGIGTGLMGLSVLLQRQN